MTNIFSTCFLCCLFTLSLNGQELSRSSLVTAGDFTALENHSISWSFGEVFTHTEQDSYHLTEGFQQGEFQATADSRNAAPPMQEEDQNNAPLHRQSMEQEQEFLAYPNPTSDQLSLNLSGLSAGTGHLVVYDANAKQVLTQSFDLSYQNTLTIDQVENLPSGKYFLQVYQNNEIKWVSTFVKIGL